MVKSIRKILYLILLLNLSACRNLDNSIRHDEIANALKSYEIPSYLNLPPIEVIYDSNPDLSEVLEDYL
jgi:hypothetical protein